MLKALTMTYRACGPSFATQTFGLLLRMRRSMLQQGESLILRSNAKHCVAKDGPQAYEPTIMQFDLKKGAA